MRQLQNLKVSFIGSILIDGFLTNRLIFLVTTEIPRIEIATSKVPTTEVPTTEIPTTEIPTTEIPTTEVSITEAPRRVVTTMIQSSTTTTTAFPTTTLASTTQVPITEAPTTLASKNLDESQPTTTGEPVPSSSSEDPIAVTEKVIESVEVIPTTRTPLVNDEEKSSSEEVAATTSVPEVIVSSASSESSVSEFSEPESTTQPTNRIEKVVTAPAVIVGEEILEPTTRLSVSREPEVTTIVTSTAEKSAEIPNIVVETPTESPLKITSRPEEAMHISSTLGPEITTRIEPQLSISEVTTRIPDHVVLDEAVNEIVPEEPVEVITEKSVSEPEVVKPTTMSTPSKNEVIEIVTKRPSLVEEVVTESHPPKIEEKINQPVTESSPLEITTTFNVDQPSSSTPSPSSSTESEEVVEVAENEVEDLVIKAVTTQRVPIKDEPVAITTVLPEFSSQSSANEVTEAPLVPTNPVVEIKTDSQSTPESVEPEEPVVTTQAIEPLKETIVETTIHTAEIKIESQSAPVTTEESVLSSSTSPSMVENEITTAAQPETVPEESDVTTGKSDFSIGGSDVTTKTPSLGEEVVETTSQVSEVRIPVTTPSGGEVVTIKFEENFPTQVPMDEGVTTPRTLQDIPVTVKASPEQSSKPEPGSKLTDMSVEIEVTTSSIINGEVTTTISTSMVPGFERNLSSESTTTSSVPPTEFSSTESSVTSTESSVTSTESPVTSTESLVSTSKSSVTTESSDTAMGESTTMNDDGEVVKAESTHQWMKLKEVQKALHQQVTLLKSTRSLQTMSN